MITSMTGYGKTVCQLNDKKITIEIKTLNSKNMDLILKIPNILREYEYLMRNMLSTALERGKSEIFITLETSEEASKSHINKDLIYQYYNEIKDISAQLNIAVSEDILSALMRMPDVLQSNEIEIVAEEWHLIEAAIEHALKQVQEFRLSEGKHLQNDILERTAIIQNHIDQLKPLESNRIQNVKDRIYRSLKELGENVKSDENRFEQELIYYLEKLDITEEKVRLNKHLQYLKETVTECDNGGKKLGFIAQEIGREINTIGSKANDADIQKIVVQMKDELEKIKEQLMNVL
jgi:uncharacterized protein (TIGR00255 family)